MLKKGVRTIKRTKKDTIKEVVTTLLLLVFAVLLIVVTTDKNTPTKKTMEDTAGMGHDNYNSNIHKVEISVLDTEGDSVKGKIIGVGPTVDQERTPFKMDSTIKVKFNEKDKKSIANLATGEHIVMDVDPLTAKDTKEPITSIKFVERH